jgi:hypothetical protein
MSDKHTPEPWQWTSEKGEPYVFCDDEDIYRTHAELRDAHGDLLLACWEEWDDDSGVFVSAEVARRIVACVNACEGIPTVMLESIEDLFEFVDACADDLDRWVKSLRRIRDDFELKERRRR